MTPLGLQMHRLTPSVKVPARTGSNGALDSLREQSLPIRTMTHRLLHHPVGLLLSVALTLALSLSANAAEQVKPQASLKVPAVLLSGLETPLAIQPASSSAQSQGAAAYQVHANGQLLAVDADGLLHFTPRQSGPVTLTLTAGSTGVVASETRYVWPGWISIAPPVLAFSLALLLRQVIPALFISIWLGTFLILGPTLNNVLSSMLHAVSTYTVKAVSDPGHATLMLFTFMIGGLVALISRNGGTRGIVKQITSWADTRARGQLATYFMGLLFFFDDYANTLVVGKTMRPVTDVLKVSREKLAYLVDSTAAPVATLALFSSWIGFQLGLIDDAMSKSPTSTPTPTPCFCTPWATTSTRY